jgi:hypothetical protein
MERDSGSAAGFIGHYASATRGQALGIVSLKHRFTPVSGFTSEKLDKGLKLLCRSYWDVVDEDNPKEEKKS